MTWVKTFSGLTKVTRSLLLEGRFNGALAVTKRVPFRAMSEMLSNILLGRKVDVFSPEALVSIHNSREQSAQPQTNGRTTRAMSRQLEHEVQKLQISEHDEFTVDMMRNSSRQFREMQELCLALEQISYWKDFEDMISSRGSITLEMKQDLEKLLDELTEVMQPLLRGFLVGIHDGKSTYFTYMYHTWSIH